MTAIHVVATMLAAAVAAPAVGHALERPGKRRLGEQHYRVVQRIYYPGFTIAGAFEVPAAVACAVSLAVTDPGSLAFALRIVAAFTLVLVVVVYWVRVHPMNRVWLADEDLTVAADRFFGAQRVGPGNGPEPWEALRDRWETGHLVRAVLAGGALALQVVALL